MKLVSTGKGRSSKAGKRRRAMRLIPLGLAVLSGVMALLASTALAAGGAHLIKNIAPRGESANPEDLTSAGGKLYFTADDGRHGIEVWHSNGTKRGTKLVKDINPGEDHSVPVGHFSTHFANRGSTLFFPATDGVNGSELWRSDGTEAGTRMVKDINPGSPPSHPLELTTVGRTLFFSADDGVHGFELWRSDGTDGGTQLVKDIDPDDADSFPFSLVNVSGALFFFVDNAGQAELWRSDGTDEGTEPVKVIDSGGGGSSSPFQLVSIGNKLFFTTYDENGGLELWRSDGTADGTKIIKDFHPDGGGDGPYRLASFSGKLFFEADDDRGAGRQLWRSDGTPKGTKAIKDGEPYELASFRGKLYVIARAPGGNIELWRSDGTSKGTKAIKVISGNSNANAFGITKVGRTFLFFTEDPFYASDRKARLWRSNGTKAGTMPIDRFAITPTGVGQVAKAGRTLFFSADDPKHGNELWKATP
jgi:ELWxxDGT repeat protein